MDNNENAPDGLPKEARDRPALLDKVKNPLGWLTLALLVVESILGFLASKATGLDFTILLVGILLFLFVLVAVVGQMALDVKGDNANARGISRPMLSTGIIIILIVVIVSVSIFLAYAFSKQSRDLAGSVAENSGLRATNLLILAENNNLSESAVEVTKLRNESRTQAIEFAVLRRDSEHLSNALSILEKENNTNSQGLALEKSVRLAESAKLAESLGPLIEAQKQNFKLNQTVEDLTAENAKLKDALSRKIDPEQLKTVQDSFATNNSFMQEQLNSLRNVNTRLEQELGPVRALGIKKFYSRSLDFIPEARPFFINATNLITLSGLNFYITLKQYEVEILDALKRGVNVECLLLDDTVDDLPKIANDFGQTTDAVLDECETSKRQAAAIYLLWQKMLKTNKSMGKMEIRLTPRPPRARCYFYDPESRPSAAYVVPYLNQVDSRNLPGLVLENVPDGLFTSYYSSFMLYWKAAKVWQPSMAATNTQTALTNAP